MDKMNKKEIIDFTVFMVYVMIALFILVLSCIGAIDFLDVFTKDVSLR